MNQNKQKIKQVVLWGYKLDTHTYSYIYYGFFKAFEYLGYNTLWLDEKSDISKIKFINTLFITEGHVDINIPVITGCSYILHNCDLTKYTTKNINILLLQAYNKDCISKYNIKQINKYTYYEPVSKWCKYPVIYMPWATDLLPHEIDENINKLKNNQNNQNNTRILNFVGTNTDEWINVKMFCLVNDIHFTSTGGLYGNKVNSKTHQELIQKSYIAPAVQTTSQVDNGYIPCRIFKNISYGKMGITNNNSVAELFNGNIIFNPDIFKTLELGIEFENYNNEYKKARIIYLMNYVKKKHTYINRIKVLIHYLYL
jgi:hypothetical protein